MATAANRDAPPAAAPQVMTPGVAALPVKRRGLLTFAVMLATIIQILDSTIANVALPHMQTALGANAETITWVLTSYIIASAIAIPMTGWVADRIGSRNLFLISLFGFIIASMLCGMATNLTSMIAFRILQGIAAAFMSPLSQTVMLDINPPERQAKAMAIWSMGIMAGPIMGPVIGGWLTESYNWRWVFYVNLPLGIVCFSLLWALLPTRPLRERRFDGFGFFLLALAIGAFQLMCDRGQSLGWFESTEILVEAGVAASAFWMFLVHLFTAREPMFDTAMLRDRNLMTALAFMVVMGVMSMAVMALLPPMMQTLYGYPVLDTGILLMPRGMGVVFSMALCAPLMQRGLDARILIAIGLLVTSLSLWEMTHWSLVMSEHTFLTTGFLQGAGMGMLFMPVNSLAFATLAPMYRTEGTSLMNLSRNIGASVGISMMTAQLVRSMQISHSDIASNVSASVLQEIDPVIGRLGSAGETVLSMLNLEVTRQAMMIAYLNDFKLMMFMTLGAIPFAFLLKRAPRVPGGKKDNAPLDMH